jgi:parallel beta-helix repeat protein
LSLTGSKNIIEGNTIDGAGGIHIVGSDNVIRGNTVTHGGVKRGLNIEGDRNLVHGNSFDVVDCGAKPSCRVQRFIWRCSATTTESRPSIKASVGSDSTAIELNGQGDVFGGPGEGNVVTGFSGWGDFGRGVVSSSIARAFRIAGNSIHDNHPYQCSQSSYALIVPMASYAGGTTAAERNYIFNNSGYGLLAGPNAEIVGNYIGVDPTGQKAAPNLGGIATVTLLGSNIHHNVISGNAQTAIENLAPTFISNNLIGLSADGAIPLPNGEASIRSMIGCAEVQSNWSFGAPIVMGNRSLSLQGEVWLRNNRLCDVDIRYEIEAMCQARYSSWPGWWGPTQSSLSERWPARQWNNGKSRSTTRVVRRTSSFARSPSRPIPPAAHHLHKLSQ